MACRTRSLGEQRPAVLKYFAFFLGRGGGWAAGGLFMSSGCFMWAVQASRVWMGGIRVGYGWYIGPFGCFFGGGGSTGCVATYVCTAAAGRQRS
ncbi:hypothetical protein BGX38DRAFT_1151468 [Terfezia claveryi]|nr:hypothetical protein BGX38DRAFT_1151468 [Terfezia claveryi]